jgi:nucleotide-binding universal stress UspA family protein
MISSVEEPVRDDLHDMAAKQAKEKLAMIATEGRRRGIDVSTTLAEGTAADEILKCAREVDADLILIATTSKGAIERALIGATAERVVREAHLPVLCVPAKTAARPQAIRRTS